jgi:hypothetical protein
VSVEAMAFSIRLSTSSPRPSFSSRLTNCWPTVVVSEIEPSASSFWAIARASG